MKVWVAWLLQFAVARGSSGEDRCTSIIVGREASGEGAPVTSHTVDCATCDFRLSKVPRRPGGGGRRVYRYRGEYPRFLGSGKGTTYESAKMWYPWAAGEGPFAPLGEIEEAVGETLAFVDGSYGIMNEAGLAIGESTCGAVLVGVPVDEGGPALVDVRELSLVAMEQCATARCAVATMGAVAERYGYYGAEQSLVEAGEALTVVDSEEAWVFHVLADDRGGASAIWAAQRVEAGHVAAVANQFVIGILPEESSLDAGLAFSSNVRDVAERAGLWRARDGPFHFAKVFGTRRGATPARYSTLRQWRVLSLAAPSLGLEPPQNCEYDCLPFSVRAEAPFPAARVVATLRDHYEGTAFDMTRGPAAGPFGDPSRFDPGDNTAVWGSTEGVDDATAVDAGRYERAISIFRCAYSFVSQGSNDEPMFWVAQYAPHSAAYVPVYVGAIAVPDALSRGSLHAVDFGAQYWAHCLVGNWAARFYRAAQTLVEERRDAVQDEVFAARLDFERTTLAAADDKPAAMTRFANDTAAYETARFVDLFLALAAAVKDGQIVADLHAETLAPQKIFYPRAWLERTDFFYAPPGAVFTHLLDVNHLRTEYWTRLDDTVKLAVAFLAGALTACCLSSSCCRRRGD